MKSWRSHLLIACAASTATAIVVGGIAFATIPNNLNGTISACYKRNPPDNGQIRIIDRQAGRTCHRGESLLNWPTRGFRWRGTWNSKAAYKQNDVVELNGSSYIALTNTTNILPVSRGYWALMAAAGAGDGATGATGATGPVGATGPTGPSGVAVCGGYPHAGIDWSGCNLTGAFLANQTLSGANLTNANLAGANITGADFTSANFTGANLTGAQGLGSAIVTGATWSGTTCPDGTLSDNNAGTCVGH